MADIYLLSFSSNIERVCAASMKSCYSERPAHDFMEKGDEDEERMIKKSLEFGHTDILEHGSFTFDLCGVSRSLTHQLVRHRLASYSQQSQRHVKINTGTEWYVLPPKLKDAKVIVPIKDVNVEMTFEEALQLTGIIYNAFNVGGALKEDTRYILPNGTKTNITMTTNPRNLRHVLSLRCDSAAQWEIQDIGWGMLTLACMVAPNIFVSLDEPANKLSEIQDKIKIAIGIAKDAIEIDDPTDSQWRKVDLTKLNLSHHVNAYVPKWDFDWDN